MVKQDQLDNVFSLITYVRPVCGERFNIAIMPYGGKGRTRS